MLAPSRTMNLQVAMLLLLGCALIAWGVLRLVRKK